MAGNSNTARLTDVLREAGIDPDTASQGERRLAQILLTEREEHEQTLAGLFRQAQASAEASTYFDEDEPSR